MTKILITADQARAEHSKYILHHGPVVAQYVTVLAFLTKSAKLGNYSEWLPVAPSSELLAEINHHGFCVEIKQNIPQICIGWGPSIEGYATRRRDDALVLYELAFRAQELERAMRLINSTMMSPRTSVSFVTSDVLLIHELRELGYRYDTGGVISWDSPETKS